MSVVVNERDKLLQAAASRLAVVTSSISAWLTNEAHTVPADSAGAVTSYAGATGDFKVISNGVDVSANFTLSTQANPQVLTVGYVGRTYTVTAGLDAGEDNALLTIRATGNAGTVYAGLTIDKVFSLGKSRTGATGATGAAAITAFLTNEAHTLPADSAGNVTSYAGATGTFKVYAGSTDVSNLFTLSTQANPQVLTVSYVSQDYTVTAGFDAAEATASLTIRATGSGAYAGVTIDKTFSLAKSQTGATGATGSTGATGADGIVYQVRPDADAIQKTIAGVYTPSTLNLQLLRTVGSGSPAAYAGRFIIATTTDGTTYTDQYTSAADESSKAYTVPASIKAIRARGYLAGGTTTLLDEQIVPIVTDGATGATGATGSTGATGTRGTVHAYGSGTVWSDTTANDAITNSTGSATKVVNDQVTIHGTGFAETRKWNGTAWVAQSQVFNGNLFVDGTITTNALVANAATAASAGIDLTQTWNPTVGVTQIADETMTNGVTLTTTGAPVKILMSATISGYGDAQLTSGSFDGGLMLVIDGTSVGQMRWDSSPSRPGTNGKVGRVHVSTVYRATTLAAGSHTFKARVQAAFYQASNGSLQNYSNAGITPTLDIMVSILVEENKV